MRSGSDGFDSTLIIDSVGPIIFAQGDEILCGLAVIRAFWPGTAYASIYDAQMGAYEIPKVTETFHSFSIAQAYQYQAELIERLEADGHTIIGYKMGLTSREKMVQMGVDAPIYGVLLDNMLVGDRGLSYEKLIHPKAEPEIAVKMNRDVAPDASIEELERAIGWVAPAVEIIDSRFQNFKFTMADVIADNCSSSALAVGTWQPYNGDRIKLDQIRVCLIINGEPQTEGVSSAVLGSPLTSLRELQLSLAKEGKQLKEGQLILTGAITAAMRIHPGDVICNETDAIGTLSFQ